MPFSKPCNCLMKTLSIVSWQIPSLFICETKVYRLDVVIFEVSKLYLHASKLMVHCVPRNWCQIHQTTIYQTRFIVSYVQFVEITLYNIINNVADKWGIYTIPFLTVSIHTHPWTRDLSVALQSHVFKELNKYKKTPLKSKKLYFVFVIEIWLLVVPEWSYKIVQTLSIVFFPVQDCYWNLTLCNLIEFVCLLFSWPFIWFL